jgi:hypothetical protein
MATNTPPFTSVPKRVPVTASSGDNTLVAAVAGKSIRVLALTLTNATAATLRLESGAGGTALTGQMSVGADSGFVLNYNPDGWCETAPGEPLNLEATAAAAGVLVYVEV